MRQVGIEFPGRGEVGFYDLGAPLAPGPTQALLQTVYSGITNGTERHGLMAEHGFGAFPGRHGYQHVCRVVSVGERVQAVAEGDVVFYGDYVGHRGWHLIEAAGVAPLLVKLPGDLDHASCALLGVAGVAMRAVRRLRVAVGERVWVVGVGPIGIFGAQCSRAVGAHVTVSEIVEDRLRAARDTGAHCVVDMRDENAWEHVAANAPYDVIFDGSGYARLFFDVAQRRLLAHGGRIGAISVRGETTFPWSMLHGTEASIEVSCHFGVSDLRCLLHLIGSGVVRIDPIVSHRVSVDDAPAIYATMRDDPRALYGVIFDWR